MAAGKLQHALEYVSRICEATQHTKHGARGLIVPAASAIENPGEDTLLPDTLAELRRLGITVREVALDGGDRATLLRPNE